MFSASMRLPTTKNYKIELQIPFLPIINAPLKFESNRGGIKQSENRGRFTHRYGLKNVKNIKIVNF